LELFAPSALNGRMDMPKILKSSTIIKNADDPEILADNVVKLAPRLASISLRVAQTCGTQRGINDALKSNGGDGESNDILNLICRDAMNANVVRICAILEREQNVVSFQSIYKSLKNQKVKDILVQRLKASSPSFYSDLIDNDATKGFSSFQEAYKSIFPPSDIYKRLSHFRNYYLAHIDENKAPTQITYDELDFMCKQIVKMGCALATFALTTTALHEDDIKTYAKRTEHMMVKAVKA
jgi:hypothetical protein